MRMIWVVLGQTGALPIMAVWTTPGITETALPCRAQISLTLWGGTGLNKGTHFCLCVDG